MIDLSCELPNRAEILIIDFTLTCLATAALSATVDFINRPYSPPRLDFLPLLVLLEGPRSFAVLSLRYQS